MTYFRPKAVVGGTTLELFRRLGSEKRPELDRNTKKQSEEKDLTNWEEWTGDVEIYLRRFGNTFWRVFQRRRKSINSNNSSSSGSGGSKSSGSVDVVVVVVVESTSMRSLEEERTDWLATEQAAAIESSSFLDCSATWLLSAVTVVSQETGGAQNGRKFIQNVRIDSSGSIYFVRKFGWNLIDMGIALLLILVFYSVLNCAIQLTDFKMYAFGGIRTVDICFGNRSFASCATTNARSLSRARCASNYLDIRSHLRPTLIKCNSDFWCFLFLQLSWKLPKFVFEKSRRPIRIKLLSWYSFKCQQRATCPLADS